MGLLSRGGLDLMTENMKGLLLEERWAPVTSELGFARSAWTAYIDNGWQGSGNHLLEGYRWARSLDVNEWHPACGLDDGPGPEV